MGWPADVEPATADVQVGLLTVPVDASLYYPYAPSIASVSEACFCLVELGLAALWSHPWAARIRR